MSKAKWGAALSFFIAVVVQFAPIPDSWRWGITIAAAIGVAISIIGSFLARDAAKNAQNVEVVAPKQSGSILSAGRDVHQTIYHGQQSPPSAERGRLKISYDGDSQDCMWPVTFRTNDGQVTWKGVMARLRVDSETESNLSGCKAAITSLEKDAKTVVSGVQLPLLFTPARDPGSDTKTIKYGQPEYLELLWIPELGEPEIKTNFPFAFSEHQKLDGLSTFSLHITFSAVNILTTTVVVDAECKSGAWTLSFKRPS